MMQQIIVALVVLAAAGAVARRYAPPSWKAACARLAAQGSRRLGWQGLAERLEAPRPATPSCSSSCATCSGCDLVRKTPSGQIVVLFERPERRE